MLFLLIISDTQISQQELSNIIMISSSFMFDNKILLKYFFLCWIWQWGCSIIATSCCDGPISCA